jgi:predicted short-subunit dehydrogenase-like oxidoreductase (DUF2520 family)
MRELERPQDQNTPTSARLAIIGRGRVGTAFASAFLDAGWAVLGPLGRGSDGTDLAGAAVVLLCVPDAEIAAAASLIAPGPLVGHCSGATGLEPLAGHEAFSLHPLMTVTCGGAPFAGAGAAIDGNTDRALQVAASLAQALRMRSVRIAPEDRVAYHAAASIASNLLITLEAAAERLAATAGVEKALLVPLIRQTVDNWAALDSADALTGPIARGDEATVAAQRHAVAERTPELLELFDALCRATRALATCIPEPELAAR